jgi:hypothetical protein
MSDCLLCSGSGTVYISEPDGDGYWTRATQCGCLTEKKQGINLLRDWIEWATFHQPKETAVLVQRSRMEILRRMGPLPEHVRQAELMSRRTSLPAIIEKPHTHQMKRTP